MATSVSSLRENGKRFSYRHQNSSRVLLPLSSLPVQYQRKLAEAEDNRARRLPHGRPFPTPDSSEALKKGSEGNFCFGPGERRAQTVMDAHAKGDMVAQI